MRQSLADQFVYQTNGNPQRRRRDNIDESDDRFDDDDDDDDAVVERRRHTVGHLCVVVADENTAFCRHAVAI